MRPCAHTASTGESLGFFSPSPAHLIVIFSKYSSFYIPLLLTPVSQHIGRDTSLPFLPAVLLLGS